MLRCAACGHLRYPHQHHRAGTDCAQCPCTQFVHPLRGWARHLIDLAATRLHPHPKERQ